MKTTAKLIACSALIVGASALMASVYAGEAKSSIGAAVFDKKNQLLLPEGYRTWVFVGAPLTPHGLNNNAAGFPEFHHVYINPDAYAIYQKTGSFPEGTVIAKELVLLQKGDHKDGSKNEVSGRGYFAGEFNGMDVMVKDSKRFRKTKGWGFFNFGHHAPPYAEAAPAAPKASCAGCHEASADKDMVFTRMYPSLR
ncbi:cytochrome P460 family protein [bacterium SCSIO 12696]|nr:cytochrome P460 family protein [bacterium SCSIO 12696]